jgi:cobalt-zinc-cadmium efflux system outer membrane protein
MKKRFSCWLVLPAGLLLCPVLHGQPRQTLTWDQVKTRFEMANPVLKADADTIDEMRAAEITAFLRPNPQLTTTVDGTQIAPNNGAWQPLTGTFFSPGITYLHERDHKRELRQQSAQEGTKIAEAQHEDLKRTLEFTLRAAFVTTLESKTIVEMAKANLDYYDHVIAINRDRLRAGDIAQIDFDRIELMRVQYESELQMANVNLRTAKIQLLTMLNDRTPVEQFDVTGPFEFPDSIRPLEDFRQMALDARPDLQAALQAAQQAVTNHKLAIANGSTDPTFGAWYTWNSGVNNPNPVDLQTLGVSVSIPLRIFDRNQGEKKRTQIDIDRSQRVTDATRAQVFNDVDTAYAQVQANIELLKPYKEKYNQQALRIRDTVTYSYEHGGASLTEFLNAQSEYRTVQLAYAQLVGAYLTAAGQLNLAVGREVMQ